VSDPASRVYTISADEPFLLVLAEAVLQGFPLADRSQFSAAQLPDLTILLPTRRAVREFERILFEVNGRKALLLPRIKPIGDIDEDELLETGRTGGDTEPLPTAVSPIGRELMMTGLIDEWARHSPQSRLAAEINASPQRAHAMALSLCELVDSLETEEIALDGLTTLYGVEAAEHREAILDLLSLVRVRLPALMMEKGFIGPKAHRSLLIRQEARRLAQFDQGKPVIAAGSTGSIPASRELLRAIAGAAAGAVVLPGLDLDLDDASWNAVGIQHPQHMLKNLLACLEVERRQVQSLASRRATPRTWLASEIMRPSETTEAWRGLAAHQSCRLEDAAQGIELVETRHDREQSLVIALILRQALEVPGKRASLVTPDRNLARRVKRDLARWGIDIDDSAGEPLIRTRAGTLISLLLDAALVQFRGEAVLALLHHELCGLGLERAAVRRAAAIIEIVLYRNGGSGVVATDLEQALLKARSKMAEAEHVHPVAARLTDQDWSNAVEVARRLGAAFSHLIVGPSDAFPQQIAAIMRCGEAMAASLLWDGPDGELLQNLFADLLDQAPHLPHCGFARVAAILAHHLSSIPVRPTLPPAARLTILGLLEARLVRPDRIVLGGLVEGVWPAAVDTGPWLNRPMRGLLGLPQPERQIGQSAHDFAQAMGCPEVYLVWPRRRDDSPVLPSRWIVRLQTLMKAVGRESCLKSEDPWQRWAEQLDEPVRVASCPKPLPRPPVAARPRKLSVTRVETLIRDPYAIYARQILKLDPLGPVAAKPDAAARGTVIHAALGDFLRKFSSGSPADALGWLREAGRRHFADLGESAEVRAFWWPRFERLAQWFLEEEEKSRNGIAASHAEIKGALALPVAGQPLTLTCRADRIDLLRDGTARIVDFKTGKVPTSAQVKSGLAPQLTLEAAMLARGAFAGIAALQTSRLLYVRLSGGEPPGEITELRFDISPNEIADRHLAGLIDLLAAYDRPEQPYIPRAAIEREDDDSDFDHLSRYREWALSGETQR